MAAVLLLYYHLAREGGITNDQTVYLSQGDFDPFAFIDVEVEAEQRHEIDGSLLREGAMVHLLCDLNDLIGEFEDDYLLQPFTRRILDALTRNAAVVMPEALAIAEEVSLGEKLLDHASLRAKLDAVHSRYVVRRFKELAASGKS
ncbi:hypothetical protein ACQ86G_19650 [Roseateles chitinivorans]|uniref:hypothetical protein n=1 Tax=Roseateles chitinivorans TaxID=2917965 RepID=UPI003D66B920